jgi:hypothetical protein
MNGWVQVARISSVDGDIRTYNLTVNDLHTFFVGHNGLWVHNSCAWETDPVKPYEVGTYEELRARSAPGDGLDLDHIPSNASNIARAEAELGRPLTAEEREAVRLKGTAVAVPEGSHRSVSPTYGGRNSPEQIQADALNPHGAAVRDTKAMIKGAKPANRAAAGKAAQEVRERAKDQ